MDWKKGRGALGLFKPLLGSWRAQAETGPSCTRIFSELWRGNYI